MNTINVKEIMASAEKGTDLAITTPKWNAREAFDRLEVTRQARKVLTDGISANARDIPPRTLVRYETIIKMLKQVELDEGQTIKWGE